MSSPCPHCRSSIGPGETGRSVARCPNCGGTLDLEAIPEAFGPYRVLGVIGRGGMGVVYHARHEDSGKEVAVKTVRVRKHSLLHRIRREIHALARLKHPGLVRIIGTGQSDGLPWYAMELLQGTTLHVFLGRARSASPSGSEELAAPPIPPMNSESHADFVLNTPLAPVGLGTTGTLGRHSTRPGVSVALTDGPTRTDGQGDPGLAPTDFEPEPRPTLTDFGEGSSPVDSRPERDRDREPAQGPGPEVSRPALNPLRGEELEAFLVLIARLCATLAYLHGEGIVHRDLKPQNVFLRPDGTPVLLDFGLASDFSAGGRESLDLEWKVEGTPEYMSPEQIRGEFVDARADLYAVGCLLYEGVTGKVPFKSGTANGTLRSHVKVPPVPPRVLNEDLPEALDALILRLLAKKASDRLAYGDDVAGELARLGCRFEPWEMPRASRDYLYRPRFVGRTTILGLLDRHIRRDLLRPGHMIFLRGSSGVGKTRVIMELARILELGGLTVVSCECQPVGVGVRGENDDGPGVRATPLHPFRPLLQAVADACLEHGFDESRRLIGPRGSLLAECEPSLAFLPGQDDDEDPCAGTTELCGEALATGLVEALGETLAEYARETQVVILVDDLQWADELTLHFLSLYHVGAWDEPNVAIVGVYRPEHEGDAMKGYQRVFQDATFLELGPLEADCIGEIVRDMLGSRELDAWFVVHLTRLSRGNPFFVAEYLRAAVAEGLLRRDDQGRWRFRAIGESPDPATIHELIPLPESLHDLVVHRLKGLGADTRRLLELAAVLGREIEPALIDAIGLLGDFETLAAVEELLIAQVLEEGNDGRFRFAHDKLREIAYEEIPPDRRRSLHRTAALAIERRRRDRDDPGIDSTLAHHWYRSLGNRASDPLALARAVEYLEKSVSHAVNAGLSGEAVEFGRAAARLLGVALPDDPLEIDRATTEQMFEIAQALGNRRPADLIGLPMVEDPGLDRIIGLLLTIHPPAFLSNQFGLFALMASKNLGLTLARGHGKLAPSVYVMYAIVARIILDDTRLAHEFSSLALELDRKLGGSVSPDVRFIDAWFVHPWVRPIRECLDRCREGAEAGLASNATLFGCYNLASRVVLMAASGEPLAKVVEAADEALTLIGRRVLVARFHCVLERQLAMALGGRTRGPTRLTDHDFDEDRDLAFIVRTSNAGQMGYYQAARLKLHYYRGEYADALLAADAAMAHRDSFARQPVEVDLVFFQALALLAVEGEDPHATTRHHQAAANHLLELARWRVDCEANFAHKALLVEAEFRRVEGRDVEALENYDHAARSAEEAGFLPHAALAHELAARLLARMGDQVRAKLRRDEAIARYRAWGAFALADRLEC